jgi:hypothetical protein
MTDANRTGQDVPALIDERRRYEAWLAALTARRESTPQHVFDRVRADYETRLRQVEEKLSSHRQAILEERTSLESRQSLLEAEEQLRRDERAELELRAHVGELAGREADEAFQTVDDVVRKLGTERAELVRRIAELDAFLEHQPEQPAATAAPEPVVASPAAAPASAPAPRPPSAPAAPSRADDKVVLDGNALHPPGGAFDELAFLSSLVNGDDSRTGGPPAAAPANAAREEAASDTLLSDLARPGTRNADEAPLGANVPGHTPIFLRTSGAIEQSKTLKCSECGAMNYPTEWYCERCGAELAAL